MDKSISFCAVLATIILFVNCTKKSDSTTFNSIMAAKINGNSFTSTTTGAVQGNAGGSNDLTITGRDSSMLIVIDVLGFNNAAGSFPIRATGASGSSTASYNTGTTPSTQKDAVHGNVSITGVSGGIIVGTFHFVASDSANISSGDFAVKP